jgi:hypothetical protein
VRVWLSLTTLLVLSAAPSLSAGEQSLVAAAAAAKIKAEAAAAGRDWHPIYVGGGTTPGATSSDVATTPAQLPPTGIMDTVCFLLAIA